MPNLYKERKLPSLLHVKTAPRPHKAKISVTQNNRC